MSTADAGNTGTQDSSPGEAEPLVNLTAPFKPAQIAQAYGFNNIYFPKAGSNPIQGDGTGQTIAIVDPYNQPHLVADLHAFDQQFGLPDPQLTIVNENGNASPLPANAPSPATPASEISLDVEWSHALRRGDICWSSVPASTFPTWTQGFPSPASHRHSTGVLVSLWAASVVSMKLMAARQRLTGRSHPLRYPMGKVGVTLRCVERRYRSKQGNILPPL